MHAREADNSANSSSSEILYISTNTGAFYQILGYLLTVNKPVSIGELKKKLRVSHSGSFEDFLAELVTKELVESQKRGNHLVFSITIKGRGQAHPVSKILTT